MNCRLFHKWTKWKLINATVATGSFDYTVVADLNERKCIRCNKTQRRRLT